MDTTPLHDRELGLLPLRGRFLRPVADPSLKVKARRHERRRSRLEVRSCLVEWLAGNGAA
jgi:hypothetical protein